jgi:nucleotide-binding universal stress UspA family protein
VVTQRRIVVGVDGSEGARHALAWAVDEAVLRDARVEVVHAWRHPYAPPGTYVMRIPTDDALESEAREVLDRAVDGVDSRRLSTPIDRILVCDGAAGALLDACKGADLLVVGSRGRGGFAGLLLGSVSQAVAQHATCPVVIVPSPPDRH